MTRDPGVRAALESSVAMLRESFFDRVVSVVPLTCPPGTDPS